MKNCIVFIFLFLGLNSFSQERTIEGSLLDTLTMEPLPFANIVVKNQNDSVVKFAYTDDNGKYSISFPKSINGKIYFTMFGYKEKSADLSRFTNDYHALNVTLNTDSKKVNEVVVVGEKKYMEKKFDRVIFNIKENKKVNAMDIYDVLATLPGVIPDRENGTVRYKGGNAEILVNNQPAQYIYPKLEMIKVNEIENIELIDRSALYGGEGKGGIINIKTKQKKESGFGAWLFSNPIYNTNDKNFITQDNYISANYQWKKVIFFTNNGYEYNKQNNGVKTTGSINNEAFDVNLNNDIVSKKEDYISQLGIYMPLEKTSIIIGKQLFLNQKKEKEYLLNNEILLNGNQYDYYSLNGKEKYEYNSDFYFFQLVQTFKKDRQLQIQTNLGFHSTNNSFDNKYNYLKINNIEYDSLYNYGIKKEENKTGLDYFVFYNHPINDSSRFNINLGSANILKYINTSNYYINNVIYNDLYKQNNISQNNAYQLSGNYGKIFGKLKLDLGLEYLYINTDFNSKIYVNNKDSVLSKKINENLYSPSFRFSYTINNKKELYFGYSLKSEIYFNVLDDQIENYLSYVNKQNPHNWVSGNSELKPIETNKLYLSYNYTSDSSTFTTEVFYNNTKNDIYILDYYITQNTILSRPENIALNESVGIDLSYWKQINSKWSVSINSILNHSMFSSGDLSKFASQYNIVTQQITRKNYGANINGKITFTSGEKGKKVSNNLYLTYVSKEITFKGYKNSYFDMSYFISKKFNKDKLMIQLGVRNILYGLFDRTEKENYNGINTITQYYNAPDKRLLSFKITYDIMQGDRGFKEKK